MAKSTPQRRCHRLGPRRASTAKNTPNDAHKILTIIWSAPHVVDRPSHRTLIRHLLTKNSNDHLAPKTTSAKARTGGKKAMGQRPDAVLSLHAKANTHITKTIPTTTKNAPVQILKLPTDLAGLLAIRPRQIRTPMTTEITRRLCFIC